MSTHKSEKRQQHKQTLAQKLYKKIKPKKPDLLTRKIIGMITEGYQIQEIEKLLEDDKKLDETISEAQQVLNAFVQEERQKRKIPQHVLQKLSLTEKVQSLIKHPPFNNAVLNLTPELVLNYVKIMTDLYPEKLLLSVGSGSARLEYEIANTIPNLRIVCIDPDPISYGSESARFEYELTKKIQSLYRIVRNDPDLDPDPISYRDVLPLIWPEYKTSQQALKQNPQFKNQLMLIDYPEPENPLLHQSDPRKNYDRKALECLAPDMCVITTSEDGGAGSASIKSMFIDGFGNGYTLLKKNYSLVKYGGIRGTQKYCVGLFVKDTILQTNPRLKQMRQKMRQQQVTQQMKQRMRQQ